MSAEMFNVVVDGTSHGEGITTVIEDCPKDILLDQEFFQQELNRRRPGQALTTDREESDEFEFFAGVSPEGYTTGQDLVLFVPNKGQHSQAYDKLDGVLRPGHGITMQMLKARADSKSIDTAGGGQASARVVTIGNAAAGAIAQLGMNQLIEGRQVEVLSCLEELGPWFRAPIETEDVLTEEMIYASRTKCPDPETSRLMEYGLQLLKVDGNSIEGTVYFRASGYPGAIGERPGIGLQARLASGLFNIPGVKAAAIGDGMDHPGFGFDMVDEIYGFSGTDLYTDTNHAGGILGGMSVGGSPIEGHVNFKPTGSVKRAVSTVDLRGNPRTIKLGSEDRHDPCIALRGTEAVKGVVRTVLFQAWLAEQS